MWWRVCGGCLIKKHLTHAGFNQGVLGQAELQWLLELRKCSGSVFPLQEGISGHSMSPHVLSSSFLLLWVLRLKGVCPE